MILNLLKLKANLKDIWDANNEFLQKKAIALGDDLVEKPLIRYYESLKIMAGMNIYIHPIAANATVWDIVCDNYPVTETGVNACFYKTPREIIVVEKLWEKTKCACS